MKQIKKDLSGWRPRKRRGGTGGAGRADNGGPQHRIKVLTFYQTIWKLSLAKFKLDTIRKCRSSQISVIVVSNACRILIRL